MKKLVPFSESPRKGGCNRRIPKIFHIVQSDLKNAFWCSTGSRKSTVTLIYQARYFLSRLGSESVCWPRGAKMT